MIIHIITWNVWCKLQPGRMRFYSSDNSRLQSTNRKEKEKKTGNVCICVCIQIVLQHLRQEKKGQRGCYRHLCASRGFATAAPGKYTTAAEELTSKFTPFMDRCIGPCPIFFLFFSFFWKTERPRDSGASHRALPDGENEMKKKNTIRISESSPASNHLQRTLSTHEEVVHLNRSSSSKSNRFP